MRTVSASTWQHTSRAIGLYPTRMSKPSLAAFVPSGDLLWFVRRCTLMPWRTGELEAMIQEHAGDGSQPDSLVNTAGTAPISAIQSYTNHSQEDSHWPFVTSRSPARYALAKAFVSPPL
ncbi:unnamed protein product [Effrenium voratum]|uniref:Uncharacterized protein n=1 Tax=Effrenium voratum TaxID=2562239 RepID=A0AA36I1M0_9DINO|nr:unnamed protein product [Effrenium voratum]CAJ1379378.1 unnamed protein product [Effrenium voratum]CAJ1447301.1 unnamed protein product [Effrenium voratum]